MGGLVRPLFLGSGATARCIPVPFLGPVGAERGRRACRETKSSLTMITAPPGSRDCCRNRSHDVRPLSPRLLEGEGDRWPGDVQASAIPTEARRPCQVRYVQLAAAPVCETGLAPPPLIWCVMAMLCFSWAACHAMPMPCHAHAIMPRRPRGDSVPSEIVLFRVDRRRIPVESGLLQCQVRPGKAPHRPWLGRAAPAGCIPSPSPLTRAESGNLTCTGGTAHSIWYRICR